MRLQSCKFPTTAFPGMNYPVMALTYNPGGCDPVRTLFLSLVTAAMISKPGVAGDENRYLNLPGIGEVLIETSRPSNQLPTIRFRDAKRRLLLEGKIGTSDPSIFRVNPLENEGGRENPILRYAIIRDLGSTPIVFAVSMYGGGSDCEYEAAAFGEHKGRLQPLFLTQPLVNAEGGMFFGDLGLGRGRGFAVWNLIWGSEGHVAPHRYRLDLYRLDAASGKFTKIYGKVTHSAYATDSDALAELGVRYPNLLRSFPALSC